MNCSKTGALEGIRCPEGMLGLDIRLSWLPIRIAGYGLKCRYSYESTCASQPTCWYPWTGFRTREMRQVFAGRL